MLDCMATYRGTDKKPYGNTMKEPTVSNLVDRAPKGGNARNILISPTIKSTLNEARKHYDSSAVKSAVRMRNSSTVKAALNLVHSAPALRVGSAFTVEPICLGKHFAPLSGN